mmetsp:Transcript_2813/g.5215  ORF Transcript_2813/g.5215 Transcript_2813/m.5215 type:complete len:82 (-) Transcript_2813:1795-2040(-)
MNPHCRITNKKRNPTNKQIVSGLIGRNKSEPKADHVFLSIDVHFSVSFGKTGATVTFSLYFSTQSNKPFISYSVDEKHPAM